MDIIVRGEAQEIDFVRRVCRDKVRRGMLAILPATRPVSDEVVKLKNERDEIAEKLHEAESRVKELEAQLPAIANVPEISETVPELAENSGEAVPEPVCDNSDPMEDSKEIETEDLTEVNLDDVKDTDDCDTKEAPAPTPKKTRSKKSE
ncbi:MAG: hypothetical protein HDS64_08875 [Bacteroidales bacterium]|nr:hypothetical protein [Bacteroidales bacterium]